MKESFKSWLNCIVYTDTDGDSYTRLEIIKAAALFVVLAVGIGLVGHFAH